MATLCRRGAHDASRRRILFVGESVSLAHVARPAVLARWAREDGHEVHFACGPRYAGVARAEGLEPIGIETVDPADFYARLGKGRFFYTTAELHRYVRAELDLIERIGPDLVVGDFRLTLPVSAQLCGVKCLSLANAHWSPAAGRDLPAPEGGLFGTLPRSLREPLFALVRPLAYRFFAAPLDRLRRSFGLPAFDDFRKHYTAGDFCAHLDLPELFPALGNGHWALGTAGATKAQSPKPKAPLPPGHFFLGPVDWSPANTPEPLLDDLGTRRPLAYVTMGSTGDGRRLPEVLRALLDAGCDMAVSGVKEEAAAGLLRTIPGLLGRAYMADFYNPRAVLSAARLTVCHGGSGTVYQSLAAGVPVLACPANPDQRLVSEAATAAGAGEIVDWSDLQAQIGRMLAGGCLAGARNISMAMAGHDTRAKWAEFLGGGRTVQRRHTLTLHMRVLEEQADRESAAPAVGRFSFGDGKYTIRVANDLESRRKAYRLIYKLYLEKEYARPHPSKMWLSIFDALPDTTTLLVERTDTGEAAGALTVVFDSPLGLPAENLYKPELDALRTAGRRLAEIVSLGVAEEAAAGSQILVKLFNFAYVVARRIRSATDFVITVNPRHVAFYRRKFFFEEAGPERDYDKVGGAPAVLLSIPLDTPDRVTGKERERTIYRFWMGETEESATTTAITRQSRPMDGRDFGYFFVAETDLLAEATAAQRAFIQERHLAHAFEGGPDEAFLRD